MLLPPLPRLLQDPWSQDVVRWYADFAQAEQERGVGQELKDLLEGCTAGQLDDLDQALAAGAAVTSVNNPF